MCLIGVVGYVVLWLLVMHISLVSLALTFARWSFRGGTVAEELSLGNFRLVTFAWELSVRNFHLETLA